ncbi:unnamed protein product [Schistosoma curassoni]|uniref:Transposase n=2 Tax=Schistosoma TaxID=6181 RepID=A0A183KNM7_9TREM|nr:unnamed protein product [Schistosoma curassoni]
MLSVDLVMRNQDESSLLKSYIAQWNKFSKQSEYLPQPFSPLENYLVGKHLNGPNKRHLQESTIRKVACSMKFSYILADAGNVEQYDLRIHQAKASGQCY